MANIDTKGHLIRLKSAPHGIYYWAALANRLAEVFYALLLYQII